MASTNKAVHFSDEFAISCGTVTVDVERSKVLLVRWQQTGEYFLPKGRKDVGEQLEQTALRETLEETGVRAQLKPVEIKTLAPSPNSIKAENCPTAVTEPIAASQRITKGILKIIFWHVASGDSTAAREEGTQQENEEFDTVWANFDHVGALLSFEDDRSITTAALNAVRYGPASAS